MEENTGSAKKMFKRQLIDQVRMALLTKIEMLDLALASLVESMESETKSSVGDKHETGRAKMQAEQVGLQAQLTELKSQLEQMARVGEQVLSPRVTFGSVIHTDKGIFFMTVPLGRITVADQTIFVISAASPLGIKLHGTEKESVLSLNSQQYKILDIY